MKFYAAAAIIAIAPAVSAVSLRSQANPSSSTITTNVALKGVSGKASEQDLDFIGKALVASYNDVHWEAGHFMTGEHSTEFVGQLCKYWYVHLVMISNDACVLQPCTLYARHHGLTS